jgi:hypothetical protein
MAKILRGAAVLAAAGALIGCGMVGTASAVFAGFDVNISEENGIAVATLHAQQQATAAGYNTNQCLKVGQSEELNGNSYFIEVDLGCGPAYATIVPDLINSSRFSAGTTLQAAGLNLGGQSPVPTCDASANTVLSQSVSPGKTVKPGITVSISYATRPKTPCN